MKIFTRRIVQNVLSLVGLFLTATLVPLSAQAQRSPVAAGTDESSLTASISLTIGQIDYLYVLNAGFDCNQGIQQPHDTSGVVHIIPAFETPSYTVFPNPASSQITIVVADRNSLTAPSYKLYDTYGRIVSSGSILESHTDIDLSALAQGPYHLTISNPDHATFFFKILKIN